MGYYTARELLTYSGDLNPSDLSIIKRIVVEGEKRLEQMEDVLRILNKTLDNYLLIKTYRAYPRIPNDIDVLSPDLHFSIKKLKNEGLKLMEYTDQDAVLLLGKTKVHLHKVISWAKPGTLFFDPEITSTGSRTVKMGQVEAQIPSFNAELLIYLAHICYEPLHATLSDLLYIYKIAFNVNWDIVSEQAIKHNWGRTLRNIIVVLDNLYHSIYACPCPFEGFNLKHSDGNPKCPSLPKSVPINYVILGVIEKKLLFWVLTERLHKSMMVIVAGDSHDSFHTPPEIDLLRGGS